MPFTFETTEISGLVVIKPRVFPDSRGHFLETYKKEDFTANGIDPDFVQDNQALSRKNALRGLHFQTPPFEQAKLVRVIQGAVFDVAVDLRKDSDTYLKYFGIELSGENHTMLYVPVGFAHGYLSLCDNTVFSYKCGNVYSPDHEAGVRWDDPDIGIDWPGTNFDVSDKDKELPCITDPGTGKGPE